MYPEDDLHVLFRTTFERASIGIAHVKLDGSWLRVNERLCEILGYDEQELLSTTFQHLTFPEDLDKDMELAYQTLEGKIDRYSIEKRYIRKDGKVIWALLSVSLVRDANGEPDFFISTVQDIMLRKQTQEMFRSTFEQAAVGIAHVSLDGVFLRCNQKCFDFLGYQSHELIGRTFQELTYPEDVEKGRQALRDMVSGRIPYCSFEKRYFRKDGSFVWAQLTSGPVFGVDGCPEYLVSVIEDIQARKDDEALLIRQKEELLQTNQELDSFVQIVSHDLQEPIRAVISYCERLKEDLGDDLSEDVRDDLKFISGGATRLKEMIGSLLRLARSGRKRVQKEPVSLTRCVEGVLGMLKVSLEDANAEVELHTLPLVYADEELLRHVYQNLIENSVKFCGEEPIRIEITSEQVDGEWVFGVKDNGIGFDAKYADRIFEPFKRLPQTMSRSGEGIGLTMCQKIIQRHGGRIWVEASPGQGAHFRFTLGVQEASG